MDPATLARAIAHQEPYLDFSKFHQHVADLSPAEAMAVFFALPATAQDRCWSVLRERLDLDREAEARMDAFNAGRLVARHTTPPFTAAGVRRSGARGLRGIPPAEYVARLAGVEVPERGNIRCPLPDHDEHTPSFHCFDDAGWYCQGCNRGGNVYDFAALLWQVPKGDRRSFRALHRRLRAALA